MKITRQADLKEQAILAVFAGVVVGVLVYVFYVSDLRGRIEAKLYDLRIRIAPAWSAPDDVALLTLDDATVTALDGPGPGSAVDAEKVEPRNLSWAALNRVVETALGTDLTTLVVLIPGQIFPYDDPGLEALVRTAKADRRLIIGLFDVPATGDAEALPAAARTTPDLIARGDITRAFRREIVRRFVVSEKGQLPHVAARVLARRDPAALAELAGAAADGTMAIQLNWFDPARLPAVAAEALVADPPVVGPRLKGRTVFVGYTAFRPWTFFQREATHVNSPWQAEGENVKDGVPVVAVHAIAAANLLSRSWLTPAPAVANLFQTVVLAVAAVAIWQLNTGFAALLFIGGWALLLIAHALSFKLLRIHVPLADTALWTSLATTFGAAWRLRVEIRRHAAQEAAVAGERELARMQGNFLDRLAAELARINGVIRTRLTRLGPELAAAPTSAGDMYRRTVGSCEELEEYLNGIRQFAATGVAGASRLDLQAVELESVVNSVLKLFETRTQEAAVGISCELPGGTMVMADRTLLQQVLYNLVSNAVKYSPAAGTIHVSLGRHRGAVTLTVRDEGPGIAAEHHERIFEKFYRVKDDHVYRLKGHGLGLYLSRYFARLMGARITVKSAVGAGSAFTLILRGARS